MFKSFASGLKEVATVKGIGSAVGIVLFLAILAYAGWGPEKLAAEARERIKGA